MTVNIQIVGNDAHEALSELKNLSAGLMPGAMAAPASAPKEETTKPLTAAQKKAAEKAAKQAISTGEERVGPEDSKEAVEQDTKDEADETAKDVVELNHDSIRGALGDYVKKFGMPAAQEDGPRLIAKALGEKTDKTAWKISEIPDTQEALAKVLAGVHEMTEKNPFKRDPVKAK